MCCQYKGCEGSSARKLQKAQWGQALPGWDAAAATGLGLQQGDGPGQSLHHPKGSMELPLPKHLQTGHQDALWDPLPPPGSTMHALLVFPFLDLCNGSRAEQPAAQQSSKRCRQPASPRGSLKCPKLENWPPPHSCLLQHNYSSMTDVTN